ncbi:leucine-rich repeat domain-containing protein [Metamycoplasma phocicerebrale]|uniref:Leucine-rich repeat domain-containing protein n=1 Tax=Metamycoplasma phocicerebrale TaxID=142649 RepID=A0A3Q9V962_9BACT|nr:leucine-rich repeat domain-containing protein [Metamycoplasma phocicerebrale]AZZ65345.1 leucine-rich repeat domain-containing protein [Metamycoplasma phocicerebrale]
MKKTKKLLLTLTGLSIPFATSISLVSCGNKEAYNEFAKDFVLGAKGRENYNKDTKTLDLSKEKIKVIPQGAFSYAALSELLIKAISPNNKDGVLTPPAGIINQLTKQINIEKIILPKSLEIIEEGAFLGLGLKEITFDIASNKLIKIKKDAFANNLLQAVVLPSSIKEIEEGAFWNNQINSINLDDLKDLKKLSVGVLAKNRLTTINLNNINTIEESALALNKFVNLELHDKISNASEKLFFYEGQQNSQVVNLKVNNQKLKEFLQNALKNNNNLHYKIVD